MSIKRQRGLDAIQPYVPGKPGEHVQREYNVADTLRLASNENPLGPSPHVLAAIAAALPQLSYYPDADACNLCRALARRLGVEAEQVRVGNGADGLIREVCVAFLEDGAEVIVSRSSFPVYDDSAYVMRANLIKTPLRNFGLDLPAMAQAISDKTKIIFVCNPNNPTGTIVTAREVDEFLAQVPEHVLVVFDEAYYEFVASPKYPDSLRYIREGRKNVMVFRTFSKVYGIAGIRLGYAVADPEVLAALQVGGEPFPVNRLALVAGEAALEDDEFVKKTIAVNREGRNFSYREFERLGLQYVPSHTNFILVRIGADAKTVIQLLLARGIIIRPGVGYDLPEFARITIGTASQNARLIEALEDVLSPPPSCQTVKMGL